MRAVAMVRVAQNEYPARIASSIVDTGTACAEVVNMAAKLAVYIANTKMRKENIAKRWILAPVVMTETS